MTADSGNILFGSFKSNVGNTTLNISGSSGTWNGILYAPGGTAQMSGSSSTSMNGAIVADALQLTGNGWTLSYSTAYGGNGTSSGGSIGMSN